MAYDPEADDDDDEYFAEISDDVQLTGKEPKFVLICSMTNSPMQLSELKVDELVKMYRDARDQLATDRKGYKAREAAVKTHMGVISMLLRDRGDQAGVDSFVTSYGTAFRNLKESFRITDWNAVVEYVKKTGNFQMLQKRTSPNAVKDIRTEEGELPPGLESHVEVEFSVRAPTARKAKSPVG